MAKLNILPYIQIRPVNDDVVWRQCADLRMRVFVEEQRFPKDVEIDELDDQALHMAVIYSPPEGAEQLSQAMQMAEAGLPTIPTVIGTLRVVPEDSDVAHIGRVAIDKRFRGCGVGRLLLSATEQHIQNFNNELGYKTILIGSQYDKVEFYKKCGYALKGEPYLDCGEPHQYLFKSIVQ
ncbi:hypothetical protein EV182_001966 [Spiromyces aspiralis]|uniref:Uncharacterized protein n=1 Tax=Spiromyces aspiralis TaxID=68401 RepID=A0ACC1I020_9FUNG|nr:hypothetical protein EV182_001966 [Spiromyces aspiralis]